jgi:hypothetical protein
MNKLIRELAEQAKKKPLGNSWCYTNPAEFEQKFAELIVEECCNRLSEETICHDGYGYNQHELYNRLRKHFGVEE